MSHSDPRTEVLWCNFEVPQLFDLADSGDNCIITPTVYCRHSPCTEAQGVRCCGACPNFKNCASKCDKLKR